MGCCVSQEPVDFDSPVDFKHFEILRAIGKGAFGKVCIVKKRDTKQMYAMKYMNKIQIIQKKAVDNVFREIQIIKSLDHPFLVNLWYAFQDEEDIFVVLDLMLGGDISYHLEKEGRFPVKRVQLYMAECALAIDYLGEKRIIHRDIKPANMLLDSKGHVHLTDFNVACIVREGRPVLSMTGTRPYMAPEVIQPSRKGYSYSVDWWSLGVSVYEMLRGERPFSFVHHMSHEDMYNMLTTVRPPASARWDEPTCSILKMLLHPDAKKRLSSLEDAKAHKFFEGLNWDDALEKQITPAYVPSQNRIHCDPTHELEEMIVEPNPLHKKKSRLSKRHRDGMAEGLVSELNKISNRFVAYDRLRHCLAALESHEGEEEGKQTASNTPKLDIETSATSLPQQNSNSNCTEKVEVHVAEAEVHGEPDSHNSPQNSSSGHDNLITIPAVVEETPAAVDGLKESPNDEVNDKHSSRGPDDVETIPVVLEQTSATVDGLGEQTPATVDGSGEQTPATVDGLREQTPATVDGSGEQTPATVDGLGESRSGEANDKQSSRGHDNLETVPATLEQTPTTVDGLGVSPSDEVHDEQNVLDVPQVADVQVDPSSKEDRELSPTGPLEATPVTGENLSPKSASCRNSDNVEDKQIELNMLEGSSNKAMNDNTEDIQVDEDTLESSSNKNTTPTPQHEGSADGHLLPPGDGNKECTLTDDEQQPPSVTLELVMHNEQKSQVQEQQSNYDNGSDDDLRTQTSTM